MPTLTLIFRGESLAFELEKIDRDRLYGYVETETTDAAGRPCSRATLAGDGRTLAGPGDTAVAYVSADGSWRERSALRAVDARDGTPIIPVKPTFASPVILDGKETTLDDYLAHGVRLVYRLSSVGDRPPTESRRLTAELEGGTIYCFPFSYRGGDLADAGFLLAGADGSTYLAVGTPVSTDYAALDAPAAFDDDEEAEDEDELDFTVL